MAYLLNFFSQFFGNESLTNSDLFSAFCSQIFPLLYASFPLPEKLPKQRLVDELENEKRLWELRQEETAHTEMLEIFDTAGLMAQEIKAAVLKKQSALAVEIEENNRMLQRMSAVFDGAVAFLITEGFIRTEDDATYQLTLKGFVNLNKRLSQAGIQDDGRHIDQLINLANSDKFSGAVASGLLASLLSGIFEG